MPAEILSDTSKVIDDPRYACVPGRWFATGIPHGLPSRYRRAIWPECKRLRDRILLQIIALLMIIGATANWAVIKGVFVSGPFIIMVFLGLLIRLSLWSQRR